MLQFVCLFVFFSFWRNPLITQDGFFDGTSCLSPYGGPSFPYVVLGGFRNGEDDSIPDDALYMNATSLILTFLIDNKADKNELGPPKAWEKK